MDNPRRTAIIVGILYIIGTAAGVLSVVVTSPLLDAPETLAEVAAQVAARPNQLIGGALLVMTMGLALAMVPVMLYPILKRQSKTLALGYVVFRGALEAVTDLIVVLNWFLVITFSQAFVAAASPDAAGPQALGAVLLGAGDWISSLMAFVFGLGALMLYWLLYQSELVPRWISVWGGIAILMHIGAGLLAMYGIVGTFSTVQVILNLPIAVQEMVMAVWLIVKGFNPSAPALNTQNHAARRILA